MKLDARLKQLELTLSSRNMLLDHSYDPDDLIKHLGLDPVAVRESARNTGRSIFEVICEMIGIEPREFLRILREKANLVR